MKNPAIFLTTLFFIISMSSCSHRFSNTEYAYSYISGKSVAVLPYEVVTTGRIPRNITQAHLDAIEEAESRAFQNSFYHQLLNRMDRRYAFGEIRVQHFDDTNDKIEKAGYTLRDTWDMSSDELAGILGVDAVIKSKVHKTQYFTNLESYGLYVAANVVRILTDNYLWFIAGQRTSDVRVSCSIIGTEDGSTLWAMSRNCPTDWSNNTYDVIERINHRISRRLIK